MPYWLITTGPNNESGINGRMPNMPVPGVGWLAHCKDTEGHIFG